MPRCAHRLVAIVFSGLSVIGGSNAFAGPAKGPPPPLIKVAEHRLTTPRQGAACAVLGEDIYVFGGGTTVDAVVQTRRLVVRDQRVEERRQFETVPEGRGGISYIERVNTKTGKVTRAPGTVLARRYHAALEHGGRFFIFGGQGEAPGRSPFEGRVEIYDPATGEVTPGPDMPEPRSGMAAVKLGAKAYLIGGTKFTEPSTLAQTNRVDLFDLERRTWEPGLPMPTPREARAEAVGEFILVVGGYSSGRARTEVEMFVPHEQRWKTLPPLERPISAHALALLDDRLYLFGDYADLDSTVAYNLRTRRTEVLRAGFTGMRHSCTAVVDGRIYVIAGNKSREPGSEEDLIQVFAPNPKSGPG